MIRFEKLNYVSKHKIDSKEKSRLKRMPELCDLKGYYYEWWIREKKEENEDKSGSISKHTVDQNVKHMNPEQAINNNLYGKSCVRCSPFPRAWVRGGLGATRRRAGKGGTARPSSFLGWDVIEAVVFLGRH